MTKELFKCDSCGKEIKDFELLELGDSDICPYCWDFVHKIGEYDDSVEAFWAWMFLIVIICAGVGYLIGLALWNL